MERVLAQFRRRGDWRQQARALNCLGLMHCEAGAFEHAAAALQDAAALCRTQLADVDAAVDAGGGGAQGQEASERDSEGESVGGRQWC